VVVVVAKVLMEAVVAVVAVVCVTETLQSAKVANIQ
jgi:hypothetical protein